MDAIVTENLQKTYPGKEALKGLDLAIGANTIHGFLGPNGAGKSTTMNILSCLMKQTGGKAYIRGKDTLENPSWVKENLGFLPEVPPLYSDMTVTDFLFFRARLYQMSKAEAAKQVAVVVEKMSLEEVKNRLIDHLSKGFKQRVGIASALISNPPILILDEPAAGLDPKSIKEIRELILALREGHTVMLSSHHLGEVGQLCDEITIIKDGKLILSDSFHQIQKQFSRKKPLKILVRGEQKDLACALEGFGEYKIISQENQMLQITISSPEASQHKPIICRRLVENQVEVFEMKQVTTNLEEIFMDLIEDQ